MLEDLMQVEEALAAEVGYGGWLFGIFRTSAEMDAQAKELGCAVYRSRPDELLLDYDMPVQEAQEVFEENSKLLHRLLSPFEVEWHESRNGNAHAIVRLPLAVEPAVAIALQAALGSDPRREFRNALRVQLGIEDPNILFRPIGGGG